jgi:hypothetical protein
MKRNILISLVIAILASIFVNTWGSISNVSACVQAPGCLQQQDQPIGKLTTKHYGFPAPYKTTVTFEPNNSNEKASNYAGYASASTTTQPVNYVLIIIDIVFWFALLYLVTMHVPVAKRKAVVATKKS